jgi:DNA processing protein
VFAIPGYIHNPLARGCHRLIRDGAKLVETGQDLLEELAPTLREQLQALEEDDAPGGEGVAGDPASPRDAASERILDLLGHDPQPADTLIEASGLTAAEVSSILLMLELAGDVSTMPGGLYVRTSRPAGSA